MVWGIKLAQYNYPGLIGIEHPSSISLPCFPCLLLLRLPQWRASWGKVHPFFPFSFEVAWRLRIACLKVTWFPLTFQATRGFGNYAVYVGCCCACQTVQCGAAEAEKVKKKYTLKARGIILKGCNSFLTNEELLWKSQVTMKNTRYDLSPFFQHVNTLHLPCT